MHTHDPKRPFTLSMGEIRKADKAAIRGSVGTFQPNANWGTRSCAPRATKRRA